MVDLEKATEPHIKNGYGGIVRPQWFSSCSLELCFGIVPALLTLCVFQVIPEMQKMLCGLVASVVADDQAFDLTHDMHAT